MTTFLHPRICSHPVSRNPTHPSVIIAAHNLRYRKMWFLFLNLYLPIFARFFARNEVKYKPILKRFLFSDSFQQALKYCRSKFVATQSSLHENNY